MKRIKVTALIWDMGNGGAQKVLINNLRAFKNDSDIEFKAVVYCAPNPDSINDQIIKEEGLNVRYLYYPRSRITIPVLRYPFNKRVQRQVWEKVVFEETPDVIHIHISELLRITLRAIERYKPVVAFSTLHSNPYRYRGINLHYIRMAFNKDGIIPICLNEKQVSQAKKQYHIKQYELVHNGVDFDDIKRRMIDKREARIKWSLNNDDFVVLAVGRLDKIKNYDLLIDVFYEVSKADSRAVLLIAGGGDITTYLQRVSRYGLNERVHFLGNVKDVVSLYCAADRFVMTSFSEASPLVLLEAQTCQVKCVVSSGVPKESAITDLVRYMKKDATNKEWCDAIISDEAGEKPCFSECDYSLAGANDRIKRLYLTYYNKLEK